MLPSILVPKYHNIDQSLGQDKKKKAKVMENESEGVSKRIINDVMIVEE